MKHRDYCKSIICLLFILVFFQVSISPVSQVRGKALRQRIAVPLEIPCPRNNLTLYNGEVLFLSRGKGITIIRIRTEYETTEQVTIAHAKANTPLPWFRLYGKPFGQSAWSLIESRRNHIKKGMKANIWVCNDGSNPIVDWQPPK